MKITSIQADNYLRITHADILVRAPILFLAGPNEAGKTSLADAVYHAVNDEGRRVKLKKDYAGLVHDGQKKGAAQILTAEAVPTGVDGEDSEPGTFQVSVPTGKRATNMQAHPLMPLLLDPARFPEMEPDARRTVVLSLHPVKLSGKAILQKLLDKKADPAKAREIGAVLLAGFPAAQAEANAKASEARGAWKQITGETYGSKKAPEWKAPKPTWEMESIDRYKAQIAQLEDQIHDLTMEKGQLGEQARAAQAFTIRRAELESTIASKARVQAKLEVDLAGLAEWQPKVAKAREEVGLTEAKPLTCPHCAGLVDVVDGKLHQHTPPGKEAAKYKALLPTYEESLAKVRSFVEHDQQAMKRITDAEAAHAELLKTPAAAPDPAAIAAVEEKLMAAHHEREAAATALRVQQQWQHESETADARTKDALARHTDVEQWTQIAELLSPSGIPSELMAAALKPLHERLAKTAAITGWEPVTIDADMRVRIGARTYSLASKSAKWRAQVALAEAMAHVSGVKTFMADEVDILDAHNRLAFLKWLHTIAPDLDTAIIIGTFKQPPTCPPTFQVEWIENGHAGAIDAEVRQAA